MQQHLDLIAIKSWDRFYRSNFINSLTGFKPVSLIGTINKDGQANLAIFSSIIHLGSDPALVGFINRPLTASHHTLSNIEATGIYTINHISPAFVQQAHQTSAKYPEDVNEFDAVGIEAEYYGNLSVPFVAASNVKYALTLVEVTPIKHNNTFLVTGSITDVLIDADIVQPDGLLALENADSLASLGADTYYAMQRLVRLSYAKPGKPVEII